MSTRPQEGTPEALEARREREAREERSSKYKIFMMIREEKRRTLVVNSLVFSGSALMTAGVLALHEKWAVDGFSLFVTLTGLYSLLLGAYCSTPD